MGYPMPQYQQYQPPPRRNVAVFILIGIFVTAALLVGLAIYGFRSTEQVATQASVVSDQFVHDLGRHQYQMAASLCATEVQAQLSPAKLQNMEALLEAQEGDYVSHGTPQWFVQHLNGQTSARLTYRVQYAKGAATVMVIMVPSDGSWRVYGCNFGP